MFTLLLALGLSVGTAGNAQAWPYEIPAKWVGHSGWMNSGIRPMVNMVLGDVDYVPGKGILINGTAILRIDDDGNPHVTLGTLKPAPGVFGVPAAVTWAPKTGFLMVSSEFGFRHEAEGGGEVEFRLDGTHDRVARVHFISYKHLLQKRDDRWRIAPLPEVPGAPNEWSLWRLMPARDGGVYALVTNRTPMYCFPPDLPLPRLDGVEWVSRLYHFDGEVWRDRTPSWIGLVEFLGICRLSDHEIALTGRSLKAADDGFLDRFDMWAAVYDEVTGGFAELPAPPSPAEGVLRARFQTVACDPAKHRLWAAADYVTSKQRKPSILGLFSKQEARLYRYADGHWSAFDLPPRSREEIGDPNYTYRTVSALAVSPDGTPWLAIETQQKRTEPLLRLVAGEWRSYALPKVERVRFYHVWRLAFDPRGQGWATALVFGGAATGGAAPLLLRFRDDHWEQQNWTWPWWRQRGWGLVGALR